MRDKAKKGGSDMGGKAKTFVIGRVRGRSVVFVPFREAQKHFTPGTTWEVVSVFLPNRYPSGTLTLRRTDGGLKDELGREIYIKKSIQGDVLKTILKEYGFKRGVDVRKYMLVTVDEGGALGLEAVDDRIGGYKWMGWGWKYIANLQEQEEDIEL